MQVDPYVPPTPSGPSGPRRPTGPLPTGSVQRFAELRDECLRNKKLFEDPEFPADDSALFYSRSIQKKVTWLRPGVRSYPF
jgi:hypothetical protein